jgi:hypothetical protein
MNVLQDLAYLLSIPRVESLIGALAKFLIPLLMLTRA